MVASFTDNQGTAEQVVSAETAAVLSVSTPPVDETPVDDNNTTTDPDPDDGTADTGTDETADTGQPETGTDETPIVDDKNPTPGDETLATVDNAEDQPLINNQEHIDQTEEILYLTDESDSESPERTENNGMIYLDNNLYKEISAGKYLNLKYSIHKYNIEMSDPDFSTEIDFNNNDLQQIVENGDSINYGWYWQQSRP